MKERFGPDHPYFKPLAWAILAHLLFLGASSFIRYRQEIPEEQPPRFRMKGVDAKAVTAARPPSDAKRFMSGARSFEAPALERKIEDVRVDKLIRTEKPLQQKTVEVAPKTVELQDTAAVRGADIEALIRKTEERELKDAVRTKPQSSAEDARRAEKKLDEAHRFNYRSLMQSLEKPLAGLNLHSPKNLSIDPEEGMPGFTPSKRGEGLVEALRPEQGVRESGDASPYEALDEFLDIELFKYADPSDGKKYFLVKIFAKKNARLKVMPKEMIFTIDCSLSITPDRLEEFKKGIRECLRDLNEGDVFNVIAFQDAPIFFRPQSIPASEESIAAAEKFVAGLTSNQRTDVNGAIEAIVKRPLARVPSNIILISDGRPTHGVVDDRELLSAVTRANRGVRPVFAFSGGRRVNRYLLDFVAYQNRAWAEYIKRTTQIAAGLDAFHEKIKDPIFLNLRYELQGVHEAETYPKSLPDFYRGAEFTLYGTYEDEGDLSMQLLGDIDGKTKQLVFTRSLKEAKEGGDDILKGWAFNKVYHLISRLNVEKGNAALLEEIDRLSKRYGILTPYSPELARLD